ncbi:hypothetical protein BJ170DRAFT_142501 [Xylariales sp. AK1849]|nr:hypothetical protein BJ170DRAFT_142501 [Xylariales sp. AK1849]
MASPPNQPIFRAAYMHLAPSSSSSQSSEPFTHETTLPPLSSPPSPKSTATYLSALRATIIQAQTEINSALTLKMEEDNRLAAASNAETVIAESDEKGGKGGKKKKKGGAQGQKRQVVDEDAEEENYGEEVVGED